MPVKYSNLALMRIAGSKVVRRVTVLALVTVVSGCAIKRMYAVKEQFCDFEENFAYTLGDQPEFTFRNPVIRATRVGRLARLGVAAGELALGGVAL